MKIASSRSKATFSKSLEFEGFGNWAVVKVNYGDFAIIKNQPVCLKRGLSDGKQD